MQEQEIVQLIKRSLQEYFSPNGENKRFFDATQIPRICNDIAKIREHMDNLTTIKISDDHETRIRSNTVDITVMKTQIKTWAGIAGVVGSLVGSFIMWALNRFL